MSNAKRFVAIFAAIACGLTAGLVEIGAQPAAAAPAIIPGDYTITVDYGEGNWNLQNFTIEPACSNGLDDDVDETTDFPDDAHCDDANDHNEGAISDPYVNPSFDVSVDADGNITAPASDIFYPTYMSKREAPVVGVVDVVTNYNSDDDVSGNALLGTIDASTGAIEFTWRMYITAGASGVTTFIGNSIFPIELSFDTANTGGVTFDTGTLSATVVADNFALPAAGCAGNAVFCNIAKNEANAAIGLPAASGLSAMDIDISFDSNPIDAGAVAEPDLSIVKTDSVDPVTEGDAISYSLDVSNVGTGATTDTVTVSDVLPAGLSFVSASGAGWSCDSTVTCTHAGPVGAGSSLPTITVVASTGAGAVASVTNTASVATAGDSNAANDSDSETTAVNAASGLADHVDVTLTGPYGYANSGSLVTGDVAVTTTANGAIVSVTGSGEIAGTDGPNATVAFGVRKLSPFNVFIGNVVVADPGAGVAARTPILFSRVVPASGTNAATGSQGWFVFSNNRFSTYRLSFTVDDIA